MFPDNSTPSLKGLLRGIKPANYCNYDGHSGQHISCHYSNQKNNQPTEQSFTKVRKKLRKILLHKKFEDLNPLFYSKDDGSYPEK